jgi:hypothetical protein
LNKEFELKKILMTLASLSLVIGLVGSAEAGATAPAPAQTTKAPAALAASTREAVLSKLGSSKHLSRQQLKALGLKPASRQQVARIKQLQKKSNRAARTSTVGCTYWYTHQYYGVIWIDSYYCGPYYSYPWYPYYVIYNNWKFCTTSGTNCINLNIWTYEYLVYYYPNSTWYYYGPSGYTSSPQPVGFGPEHG